MNKSKVSLILSSIGRVLIVSGLVLLPVLYVLQGFETSFRVEYGLVSVVGAIIVVYIIFEKDVLFKNLEGIEEREELLDEYDMNFD